MDGDSKSTNERVLPWLVRWACRAGTRDFCSALAALVGPVQNFYFSSFVPVAQQAGQEAVLGRLSLSMCLLGPDPDFLCLRIKIQVFP